MVNCRDVGLKIYIRLVSRLKDALDWNPQGKRRRGRLKKTWKRTVGEEARD
jgi:hypothetical protein